MTRAELLALAERLDGPYDAAAARAMTNAAAILRKIAEAQPVAWTVEGYLSGEPDLCFEDERERLQATHDETLTFAPLYSLQGIIDE